MLLNAQKYKNYGIIVLYNNFFNNIIKQCDMFLFLLFINFIVQDINPVMKGK